MSIFIMPTKQTKHHFIKTKLMYRPFDKIDGKDKNLSLAVAKKYGLLILQLFILATHTTVVPYTLFMNHTKNNYIVLNELKKQQQMYI